MFLNNKKKLHTIGYNLQICQKKYLIHDFSPELSTYLAICLLNCGWIHQAVLVSGKQPPAQQTLVGVGLHPVRPGRRQVHRGTPVKLCAVSYCQGN